MKARIAVFASGSGTNAENLIKYFLPSTEIEVVVVLTNKPKAMVRKRAESFNVPSVVFSRQEFYENGSVEKTLREYEVDYIVLAGFLWLVPGTLIDTYSERIINLHPSLLPAYGGKGMYGHFVHEAVIANKERSSGITIHLVNQVYDEGRILEQFTCTVDQEDTPELLAAKIHELEYAHFPRVVEEYVLMDH